MISPGLVAGSGLKLHDLHDVLQSQGRLTTAQLRGLQTRMYVGCRVFRHGHGAGVVAVLPALPHDGQHHLERTDAGSGSFGGDLLRPGDGARPAALLASGTWPASAVSIAHDVT